MSYIITLRNAEIGDISDPRFEVERGLDFDVIPELKGQPIVITGRHGAVDLRRYLSNRGLKVNLILSGDRDNDIEEVKDEFLRLLDITGDPIPIVLQEFPALVFYVRVISIDLTQWIHDVRLMVEFKAYDPYLYELNTQLLIGNGTIELDAEAIYHIELDGPATDPVITIGDNTLEFEGGVAGGETLIITQNTITKEGEDVLPFLYGDIPLLLPVGSTSISTTSGSLNIYYRRRYVIPVLYKEGS
jgi:phage-related protein